MVQETQTLAEDAHPVSGRPELRLGWTGLQQLMAELYILAFFAVQRITAAVLDVFNESSYNLGLVPETLLVLGLWALVQPVVLGVWFLLRRPYVWCRDPHLFIGRGEFAPAMVDLAAIERVWVERGKLGRSVGIEYRQRQITKERSLPVPQCFAWPPSSVARFEREAALLLEHMGQVENPPVRVTPS